MSCCLLEIAGAAVVTAGQTEVSPSSFTNLLPGVIGKATLLAICLGAVAANVLNVYSGAMSFMALGFKVPLARARAIVAVVFGILGLVLASFGLQNAGASYESFLLIIAYWIAPWLGVVFTDRYLRRGQDSGALAQSTDATSAWPGRSRWSSAWRCRSRCSPTRPSTRARSRRRTAASAT